MTFICNHSSDDPAVPELSQIFRSNPVPTLPSQKRLKADDHPTVWSKVETVVPPFKSQQLVERYGQIAHSLSGGVIDCIGDRSRNADNTDLA